MASQLTPLHVRCCNRMLHCFQRGCANQPWPGGTCVWDKQHACDPDVVAAAGWPGVGFVLDGKPYQFAMFYLGIHQDSASGPGFPPGRPFRPVEANHIGVAVAESLAGPWFKKSGPVIIGACTSPSPSHIQN